MAVVLGHAHLHFPQVSLQPLLLRRPRGDVSEIGWGNSFTPERLINHTINRHDRRSAVVLFSCYEFVE